MYAVGLIELWLCRHAIEEETIEDDIMLVRETPIDRIECVAIFGTEIRRGKHSGEQNRHTLGLQAGHDRVEIGEGLGRFEAAQSVIGAELDNNQIRIVGEHPVETRAAARRGVTRNPGIDHAHADAARRERSRQPHRKRCRARHPVAGGQTVAERDHHHWFFRRVRNSHPRPTGHRRQHEDVRRVANGPAGRIETGLAGSISSPERVHQQIQWVHSK